LDGDARVQQALRNGELVQLASSQREQSTQINRKMAIEGHQ